MAQIREQRGLEIMPDEQTLLRHAAARLAEGKIPVNLNVSELWLKYGADVDLLTIRFVARPRPNRTDDDIEEGILYNYEDDQLVSIEILDITDRFTDAA